MEEDPGGLLSLEQRVLETVGFLREELARYRAPVAMVSFGKDSMAMLHLLRSHQIVTPVVCYRDPWYPRKYAFANRIIEDWNLEVYDYPPIRASMLYGKGIPAFVNEYQTGPLTTVAVPKNIVEYREGDPATNYLCGVDFFTRPLSAFSYPWDAALVGHKDCDSDQIYGDVPLRVRVLMRDEGPDYLYPLKEWSHDEVWDYLECFEVPVQEDRYDVANRCEREDKTYNSDYWQACIRCVDKRLAAQVVHCPKFGAELRNVSQQINEFDWQPDYFETS